MKPARRRVVREEGEGVRMEEDTGPLSTVRGLILLHSKQLYRPRARRPRWRQNMSTELPDEIKRWTAKRRTALVLEILRGETTVNEAARASTTSNPRRSSTGRRPSWPLGRTGSRAGPRRSSSARTPRSRSSSRRSASSSWISTSSRTCRSEPKPTLLPQDGTRTIETAPS
mgnify:CR=1 FL=1